MFDFRKFADVADNLSKQSGDEYNRSAISRYYYSIFCCARLYLIFVMNEDEFLKNNNIHSRVCNRLMQSNDLTEHALGKILDKLRENRNLADYDWSDENSSFFKQNVEYIRNESKAGLQQIESLRNSPPFRV